MQQSQGGENGLLLEEPCKQTVNMESERFTLWLERHQVKVKKSQKPRPLTCMHMSLQSSSDIMSLFCQPGAMESFDGATCQWIAKKHKEAGNRLAIIIQ